MMIGLTFLQPHAAWALPVWLAVFVSERAWCSRQLELRRNELGERVARQLDDRSPVGRSSALFLCALLCGVVAAMQPSWNTRAVASKQRGCDVVICLDVSRSMLAADLRPSRLEQARADIRDMVRARPNDRFSLVAFAGEARTLIPLTDDHASFLALLELAEPHVLRVGGTAMGTALQQAARGFADQSSRAPIVMLLTDGEDHDGSALQQWRDLRPRYAVDVVGYGTEQGAKIVVAGATGDRYLVDQRGQEVVSKLRPTSLVELARQSDGSYRSAIDEEAWRNWLERELPQRAQWFEASDQTREPIVRQTEFLLLGLIFLLAAAWRGGPIR